MIRVFILLLSLKFLFASDLQTLKIAQVQKATYLAQYVYDLKKLNQILLDLNNAYFKEATGIELGVKNSKSKYTIDYIKALLKVLNGTCNKGYIKEMEDKFSMYKGYLYNYPTQNLIIKNFDVIENRILNALNGLKVNLKKEKNIRPFLKIIFQNLIWALKEIQQETLSLKKLGLISPFTIKEDEQYCLPKNWAQTDGKTTLADIINFIVNGDKKYNLYGIKYYYDSLYNSDKPLVISY